MKLLEFFSKPIVIDQNQKRYDEKSKNVEDDLFWYILDHDKLHKDYFFPIAKKIKGLKECGEEMIYELFMPMVKKGCREYYIKNHMQGKLGKKFPKEMREGLCKKLYNHFNDDIQKQKYQLG